LTLNFELLQLFDTQDWTAVRERRAIASMPGPSPLRRSNAATASAHSGALVDVIVLSADLALFDAIRDAIGERNPVWRARSAEESVDLLITGRCGVLLVDLASVSTQPDTLIQQIVDQFPDVVVCVAGMREDEPLLAPLISDGLVYRFMHKPLSPRRAGMFLQAAIRHHCERDQGVVQEPILRLVTSLPSRFDPWKWVFVTLGVALFVMILAALFGHREPQQPSQHAATVAAAPAARTTSDLRADPVLSRARAAFDAGRYETPPGRNALDLFKAVLLAHPDNAEAQAGLDKTIDRILDDAGRALEAGDSAEAQRLVDRALEADPGRRTAVLLAQRMRKIGREPVATVIPPPVPTPAAQRATVAAVAAPSVVKVAATPVIVRPDPLTPHFTNAPPAAAAARTRTRTFGAPISPGLPTAGYVKAALAEVAPAPAASVEPARDAFASGAVAASADSLERLVTTDPVYPPQALRNGTAGWVELEFTITPSGGVGDIAVVEAEPRGVFEQAATTALGTWRFRPRIVNGQPVAQRSTVTMHFDVDG
jgi:protein TonB